MNGGCVALGQLPKTKGAQGRVPTICKSGLQWAIVRCIHFTEHWQLSPHKNIIFIVFIIHSVDKSQIAFEYLSESLTGKFNAENLVIITFALCAF